MNIKTLITGIAVCMMGVSICKAWPWPATTGTSIMITNGYGHSYEAWINCSPDYTVAQMIETDTAYYISHPNALLQEEPTVRYNCFAYVYMLVYDWFPNEPLIWLLDVAKFVKQYGGPPPLAIINYMEDNSTAFIRYDNGQHYGGYLGGTCVISKWGSAGKYAHSLTDCPYLSEDWTAYAWK